ncbi:MAG: CHASE domain-containing protein [Candidatus Thiodiazotropha sp.]
MVFPIKSNPFSAQTASQSPAGGETSPLGWLTRILLITTAIFIAAKLSQHLTTPPSNASPVWPGAGIALAVTLLYGPRALIGIFLGAVAFEFQLFAETAGSRSFSSELILAFGLGLGACLQAQVGATLIRRLLGPLPRLVRDLDILRFQLLGGPVACTVSASIGMGVLWSLGIVTGANLSVDWLTWWVGDSIGAIIFAPLVLIFLNRNDPLWRGRKTTVALPMLLLLLAAIAFYSFSNVKESEEKELKFHEQARAYHHVLMREFETHLEILDSLKNYFEASQTVSRQEFHIITRTVVEKHAGIQALEWIPKVPDDQRAEFEKSLPGGGPIHRLDDKGELQPAESRAAYFAIQYIEPPDENRPAFGFDVTSNPIAAQALRRARDSGKITGTGPVRLVQETADEVGIALYNPVYRMPSTPVDIEQRRASLIGFVAAVFRMQSLIGIEMPNIAQGMIALHLRQRVMRSK